MPTQTVPLAQGARNLTNEQPPLTTTDLTVQLAPATFPHPHEGIAMSWIDDSAYGAGRTDCHRNPPEECARVIRLVCSYAHDVDDARELCATLGLNPRDGRRTTNVAC